MFMGVFFYIRIPFGKLKILLPGSGKRALLEVISRRAPGPTRGQILLNGAPMSMRLFQVFVFIFWKKEEVNQQEPES